MSFVFSERRVADSQILCSLFELYELHRVVELILWSTGFEVYLKTKQRKVLYDCLDFIDVTASNFTAFSSGLCTTLWYWYILCIFVSHCSWVLYCLCSSLRTPLSS